MKLEFARGLFMAGALAVVSLAVVGLEQPRTKILSAMSGGTHCPLPRAAKSSVVTHTDNDELLLFMFGMTQGMKRQS
ncbi:hypothetical protein BK659_11290 [Pseudomonas brassicacearum]|uniref:Uncharacterized protein n=1 Tax=Pseudomonas brassicacearum TaxID=930166 RepID=A0A423H8I9_9PSED|nr:hypothetical protein [Pseudomonas brassicacearum]RON09501.1 hypothetical protein BK659_11290 [Pseudomonas brassicacearum]